MANKEYKWHGFTYRIADEDLERYPGAVPVEKPGAKGGEAPANKAATPAADKAAPAKKSAKKEK